MLGDLVDFDKGRRVKTYEKPGEGRVPYIGAAVLEGKISVYANPEGAIVASERDVLMLWDGERSGLVGTGVGGVVGSTVSRLRPTEVVESSFLFHALDQCFEWIQARRTGTGVPHVPADLGSTLVLRYPSSLTEQRRIAEILDTLDDTIRKTEEVITKLKQMKQGLLHDLLTRGIDGNGELRDPERNPELFADSPLGRIPHTWEIAPIDSVLLSAVDGPFGSNLKTEHYVSKPGVRVVRLQNLGVGNFLDNDRAYVSDSHAKSLSRHQVLPGDLLVASLGDGNHPIGRACLYPHDLPPAIVKADCFRLRTDSSTAIEGYLMLALNHHLSRGDISAMSQGVTRDRINLSSLRQVRLALPPVDEQTRIFRVHVSLLDRIHAEEQQADKLRTLKQGLMDDLLTGRVRVPISEEVAS